MSKRKPYKRLLILLLAFVLCLAVALPALALDDYPDQYKYAGKDALTDEWRFYNRECVSFVAWCLNSRNGIDFSNFMGGEWWGNANTWSIAARNLGYRVDNTPAVGAVAYWDYGYYGHVAWVAAVNGSDVYIEEYNYDGDGTYHERVISPSTPTGFIHIKDLSGPWAGGGSVSTKAPVSVSFSPLEDEDYTCVTETDAVLGQEVTVSGGSCSEIGLLIFDEGGIMLADAATVNATSGKVFFSVSEDCNYILTPATAYKYSFYAVVDGKTYRGDEAEFRTLGDYLTLDRSRLKLSADGSELICVSECTSPAAITWHSSDRSVATVSGGRVYGVNPGTALITARSGSAAATCLVSVIPAIHFPAVNEYEPGMFADVGEEQWFAPAVAAGYKLGLIKGTADGFNPDGAVTLAETVTMAVRIHSIYLGTEPEFAPADVWYRPYFDYAYANGLLDEDLYALDPGRAVTRAQFARIMAKALPEEALYPLNRLDDGVIPDIDYEYLCYEAVYALYRAGILTGSDSAGSFCPDEQVSRAAAAAIVSRMAESDNRVEVQL